MRETDKQNVSSYREAGVDIDAGDHFVDLLRPLIASTQRPGAGGEFGGFGSIFDLKAAGWKDPLLVSGTDGVGTKLAIAFDTGLVETIGLDLVAMCANDILAQGAEPLFFLDYFATGKLRPEHAAKIAGGIAAGCQEAGCALIGGETAEMPGFYPDGVFDLAGFVVGAVDRQNLLPKKHALKQGDLVVGLASSGAHANGFSLIRKIVRDQGLSWEDAAPFAPETSLGEALMTPTRLYIRSLLPLLQQGRVKACAHITGGGLVDNPPRMLPSHLTVRFDESSWTPPPLFQWLGTAGGLRKEEALRVFNHGVGFLAVADAHNADSLVDHLNKAGEQAWIIGEILVA